MKFIASKTPLPQKQKSIKEDLSMSTTIDTNVKINIFLSYLARSAHNWIKYLEYNNLNLSLYSNFNTRIGKQKLASFVAFQQLGNQENETKKEIIIIIYCQFVIDFFLFA